MGVEAEESELPSTFFFSTKALVLSSGAVFTNSLAFLVQ